MKFNILICVSNGTSNISISIVFFWILLVFYLLTQSTTSTPQLSYGHILRNTKHEIVN